MRNILVTVFIGLLAIVVFRIAKNLYLKPKNITGEKAIEITGQLPDGTSFALSQLKGKYVLLDFWGSWCGPLPPGQPQSRRPLREIQ
jgi:thiol-disulfide isomerase/thioredoxin